MPEIKYGIDDLKPALILSIEVGISTVKQFSDGFQPIEDLLALLASGTKVQAMLKNKEKVVQQFLDVDTEEGAQLNKDVAEHFKIDNKKAERRIKAGFNVMWGLIYFIDELNEPGDLTGQATVSPPVQ